MTAPVTVAVDANPWLAPDATRVDALVTVTGPGAPPPTPPDVLQVVVVDCSGSMLGDKIEQARTATSTALAALPDGTLFAVVAGTSGARPVYPAEGAARADGRSRAEAVAAVRALHAGGGTRLGVWLDAVRAIAEGHPGAVRHALLITDGRSGEPRAELHASLERCLGAFTCDCRGIGTGWEVGELREIATTLLGDVDIVAEPGDLPIDLARALRAASRRSVPGVVLRLWSPERSRVRAITQVAPDVRELTGALRASGPGAVEVALGDWGAQRLVHYAGQVELAGAVRDGLRARRGGDDATATLLLGRARELAERSGHQDTPSLLDDVAHDTGAAAEMTLDVRGRRSRTPEHG